MKLALLAKIISAVSSVQVSSQLTCGALYTFLTKQRILSIADGTYKEARAMQLAYCGLGIDKQGEWRSTCTRQVCLPCLELHQDVLARVVMGRPAVLKYAVQTATAPGLDSRSHVCAHV